ncbi:hypothetical protein DSCO28_05990 [Desulfosarcina ovata subsp. sediminis]|uniref:PilZ domain-containing protein n=1 Tax=Desulfosarcina ovata subsp. sediminis TaxID=885957 RepID=A0A5K7ZQV5_9BACT|nr:hypothetical protein [Desulfosarcina ovata]BBO80033.1 hypothetical protein DSCO28_05990 [Desulfosarcina ovata subsp. sediminis]
MKTNLITLILSSAVAVAVLVARESSFLTTSVHGRYYFAAIMLISVILALITLSRLIRSLWRRPRKAVNATKPAHKKENRSEYRIQFDHPPHPIFIENSGGPQSAPAFTCPVLDVSETGVSLGYVGVYFPGQTVQGEIIFASGRSAPINGVVARQTNRQTVLLLHCTIDPSILMAEQRERIALQKDDGPRPAVSPSLKDNLDVRLPSHQPKGVCRLKRS